MRMRKSTAASGFHRFQTGNPRAPRLRKERDKIENEAHSRRRMRLAITKRGRDRIASNRSLTSEMRPRRMHRGEPLPSWHYFCICLVLGVEVCRRKILPSCTNSASVSPLASRRVVRNPPIVASSAAVSSLASRYVGAKSICIEVIRSPDEQREESCQGKPQGCAKPVVNIRV